MSSRVTMADVARAAGVSRPLVSVVLSGGAGAGADTRDRILATAKALGYRPDAAASMLRSRRSRQVGVVFNPRSSFEADLIEELYTAAAGADYRIALGAITAGRSRQIVAEELIALRCEAVVVVGAEMDDRLDGLGVPVVVIGERFPSGTATTVGTDEWHGAHVAVQHLITLGHRAIIHVDGGTHPGAAERARGYADTMAAAGLRDISRRIPGDYTETGGAEAARALLDSETLPTAVFLANDQMAIGFLDVMRRSGVRVPETMSVIGYDDSRFSSLAHVDLSTVRQDIAGLAGAAFECVADHLETADPHPVQSTEFGFFGARVLEPELVVRGTTAVVSRERCRG
ncbi:LacI family DNA-binding transcriptional regulator [Williamsia maris]|uniref:Transcriptional regulator, LacI family n=1 Tax=Williamsia maris TaxID=72806 RepID=A0ABT1HID2_9NOCA|nr:LacI family DNA-binding transcriptional regulator [Williamsia maris]MCP2177510.1 transcriptional regulator, LacI family [Williamsia maris]